jgi:hypothetical protein
MYRSTRRLLKVYLRVGSLKIHAYYEKLTLNYFSEQHRVGAILGGNRGKTRYSEIEKLILYNDFPFSKKDHNYFIL